MPALATTDLDHTLEHVGDSWQALAGSRLFLTGGTGFVGKWLLESLLWANDQGRLGISATVLTRDPERFRAEAPHLAGHTCITLLRGDIQDFPFPDGDFSVVIHAATVEATPAQPFTTFTRDLEGTRRVLEFARTHGTRRLLFTSSGAVYGKQPPEMSHMSEDYAGAPQTNDEGSAYGHAKRASEFMCTLYARQYGFAALLARLFAFIGPYLPLNRNFAAGNFIRDAVAGGPIQVQGDGTPYRSYLYAADMAVWLWTILIRGVSSHPYNVGSSVPVSIEELANTIANVASKDLTVNIAGVPVPESPRLRYVPSVERAWQELGLRPTVALEDGARRTYNWTAQNVTESSGTDSRFVRP